jgi:hypothetical protein
MDPATAELSSRPRSVAIGYLNRLRASGCTPAQLRAAESLLLAGARNRVSAKPIDERDDADVCADIDAAWDMVVQILRRDGIRP